ncbi:MAG TPA: hypothetical protein VJ785_11530 [Anaerolineales bacterium]|nr:hypothetical protein [Anaerolineales bacterium]
MMQNRFSRWIAIYLVAVLIHVSCSFSVSLTSPPATSTSSPQATDTQETPPKPTETQTDVVQPTFTSEGVQFTETTAASPEPSCTILQDLNLRFGPGTAYRPPIRALLANSLVTPLGFAPQGIPGGSWAYVEDRTTQDKGWVSAGPQYISCNIDLTTLPPVDFGTPPPPPLPGTTQTSDPDGNGFCIDPDSGLQCVGVFSRESLFQFRILSNGNELSENDGVEEVDFTVRNSDGDTVYSITEVNRAYCIFGGNGPCNPWVNEGGIFKWTPGGAPVQPGEYEMDVNATVNGEDSRWAVEFTLTLP